MEADDFRLQFDDHIAHFPTKRSRRAGRRGRCLDAKLRMIMGQALSPSIFDCFISTGRRMAEEVEIYWFAGSSANVAERLTHLRR
jgi:hypothetical protein